ncbi:MAG: hypothetical protein Q7S64_02805, partial [bacterium]|nr:hypothetical protein [bacterium]
PTLTYCPGGSVKLAVRLRGRSRQGTGLVNRQQVFNQDNDAGVWDGIWGKAFRQVHIWAKEQAVVGDDQLRLTVEWVELCGSNEDGVPLPISSGHVQPYADRALKLLRANNQVHHERWRLKQRHSNTVDQPSLP